MIEGLENRPVTSATVMADDVRVGMLLEIEGVKYQVHHISVHGQEYLTSPNNEPKRQEVMFTFTMCSENGEICQRAFPFTVNLRLAYVEVFEPGIPKGFASVASFKKLYVKHAEEPEPKFVPHAVNTRWRAKAKTPGGAIDLGDLHIVYSNEHNGVGYVMLDEHGRVASSLPYEKFDAFYVPADKFIWKGSKWRAKHIVNGMGSVVDKGRIITVYHVNEGQDCVRAMLGTGFDLGNYGAASLREDFELVDANEPVKVTAATTAANGTQLAGGYDALRMQELLRQRGNVDLATQTLNEQVEKFSGDRLHHYQCPLGGHGTGMKHSTLTTPCWCGARTTVTEVPKATVELSEAVGSVLTEAIEGGMGAGYKGHFAGHDPTRVRDIGLPPNRK